MTRYLVGVLVLLLALDVGAARVRAVHQQAPAYQWLPPLNLFETEGRASEAEVVTDPSGTVHVFWAYGAPGDEESGDAQAIYYIRKDGDTWTEPVDILVSPGNRVSRMHSVAVDGQGYLHVVWSGGDVLYYSRAYAPDAGSARGWTTPVPLASGIAIGDPSIATDGQDQLVVVWTEYGSGLLFVSSEDGGRSWSATRTLFTADQDNEAARWGRIAVDDAGRLHVAFTHALLLTDRAQGGSRNDPNYLYYMRSDDEGRTWSEPLLITPEPDFGEVNVATFGPDIVHLAWNGRAGRFGRYHRWSQDGGHTWSDEVEILAPAPRNPVGTGGLTGFPAMVADSTGVLHLVSATGSGQYYFRWSPGGWTAPVLISPGVEGGGVTGTTESIEQPSLAIGEGNRVHVVFHDGFERIWYTSTTADAPYQPPVELPTPSMIPTATPTTSPTLVPTASQEPTSEPVRTAQPVPAERSSSYFPLLVALVPAVLLVGGVVLMYSIRRR